MERRTKMEFFLENYQGKPETEINLFYLQHDEYDVFYAGCQWLTEELKYTYYFYPQNDGETLLFAYIGDNILFKDLFDNLNNYNYESIRKTFPLLFKAADNKLNANYSQTCLCSFLKPTGTEYFWCFAISIGNMDFTDIENEHILEKVKILFNDSIQILFELSQNKLTSFNVTTGFEKPIWNTFKNLNIIKNGFKK